MYGCIYVYKFLKEKPINLNNTLNNILLNFEKILYLVLFSKNKMIVLNSYMLPKNMIAYIKCLQSRRLEPH